MTAPDYETKVVLLLEKIKEYRRFEAELRKMSDNPFRFYGQERSLFELAADLFAEKANLLERKLTAKR